jgi:hypothetical protein
MGADVTAVFGSKIVARRALRGHQVAERWELR